MQNTNAYIEIVPSRLWGAVFFLLLLCSFRSNAQVTIVEKDNVPFTGRECIYISQEDKIDNEECQTLSSKKENIIFSNDVVVFGQNNFNYVTDNETHIKDNALFGTNKKTSKRLTLKNDPERLENLKKKKHNFSEGIILSFKKQPSSSFYISVSQFSYLLSNNYEYKFGLLKPFYKKQEIIYESNCLLIGYHKKRFQNISKSLFHIRLPPVLLG